MIKKIKKIAENIFVFLFVTPFTGIVRPLSKKKQTLGSIIVLSLHKLGDSVFTIPAIKSVVHEYPDQRIILVCFNSNKPIYEQYFGNQVQIKSLKNPSGWLETRIPSTKFIKNLRNTKAEILYDISPSYFTFLTSVLAGAQKNVGTNKVTLKKAYDKFTIVRETPHLIDKYLDIVGLEIPSALNINKEYELNYNKNDIIYINTLAGWSAKEWEFDNFIELANILKPKYNIMFIHEKNSVNNELFIKNDLKYVETESVKDLIEKLCHCSVIIGNDSGPIYIANMLGKPTFAIYGPTNPQYSFPFGSKHRYIREEVECTPFVQQYCVLDAGRNCSTFECLKKLKVDKVAKSVLDFLAELEIDNKKS